MLRLRLWWYNAVKRHWNDWRAGDGVKSGKITAETLEWARGYFEKHEQW
jgi:hypothetical protein